MSMYIDDSPFSIEEEIAFLEDGAKHRVERFYENLEGQNYSDAMVLMKLMEVTRDNIHYLETFMKDTLPLIMKYYEKYYNHYHKIKNEDEEAEE